MEMSLRLRHALGLVDSLWNIWQPSVTQGKLRDGWKEFHDEGALQADDWTYADICAHARAALHDSRLLLRRQRLAVDVGPAHGRLLPPEDIVRVMNAFSGMYIPAREQHCAATPPGNKRAAHPALRLEVTNVDNSARAYLAALAKNGWVPHNGVPAQCDAEELWRCFPSNVFELVHVRNGLDHTPRPLQCIRELLNTLSDGRVWRVDRISGASTCALPVFRAETTCSRTRRPVLLASPGVSSRGRGNIPCCGTSRTSTT